MKVLHEIKTNQCLQQLKLVIFIVCIPKIDLQPLNVGITKPKLKLQQERNSWQFSEKRSIVNAPLKMAQFSLLSFYCYSLLIYLEIDNQLFHILEYQAFLA